MADYIRKVDEGSLERLIGEGRMVRGEESGMEGRESDGRRAGGRKTS